MSAATRILAIAQKAPDISTNDSAYVSSLIGQAQDFIRSFCQLERFPDQAQGTSVSAAGATEDISGLAENSIYLDFTGDGYTEILPTLANCNGGDETAAELQSTIRAKFDEQWLWASAAVTWDSDATTYTITSPSYGPDSVVHVSFATNKWHVAEALKIGPLFGGTETPGSYQNDPLEAIAAQMVINAYRRIKLIPSDYDDTSSKQAQLNSAFWAEDEMVKRLLLPHRRLR